MRAVIGPKILMILILTLAVMLITWVAVSRVFPAANQNTGPVTKFDSMINQASFEYGVEVVLIKAVIMQESGFNPSAESSLGAQGLMQLMPGTASDLGSKLTTLGKYCNLDITDRLDPEQNINGGTCYLSYLLKRYDNNKELALAAYNAGPGNVDKCNCIPNIPETQQYVRLVSRYYDEYKSQSGITVIT